MIGSMTGRPRLLLVEDDDQLGPVMATVLDEVYDVTLVADGGDALDVATSRTFDVMVVDRRLPTVDGVTVVETLRRSGASVPMLILTALGTVQDKVRGLDAGADDYLVKPFEFDRARPRIPVGADVTRRTRPRDADGVLVRSAAWRVALTITGAVSVLVLAVLVAAFSVVLTQVRVGDLLHPTPRTTLVDVDAVDILLGAVVIGVCAIASAGLLGWLVTRRVVRPLVDALRRQRQFVADASHELRTPLAILDARIQMLHRSVAATDPHARVVEEIRADSRTLNAVVADLLESVEMPISPGAEPTAVVGVLESAVTAMTVLARRRDVHLVSGPHDGGLGVDVPPAGLQRSIVALVDNAVKHSPPGAIVVVTARREGRHVRIDVTDEGPGIRGIAPDRVFDRFARSAHAVDGGGSSRTGFGIGLSLVQEAVARYGGSASVSDTSEAGTTMTLRIPSSSPGRRRR